MKWAKERDDLIAQTKAFVLSVTGRRPEPTGVPAPIRPAPIDNPFSYAVTQPISSKLLPGEGLDPIPTSERAQQAGAVPQSEMPRIKTFDQSEVRQEIQNRIAAFQAHQHRFHRERDAYYKSVLNKARLGVDDGHGGSQS